MKSFQFTRQAERDLDEIYDHVAMESGPGRARALHGEILSAVHLLAQVPGMGHGRSDLTPRPLRFWPVHRWLIVYRPETSPLLVTRVIGGWQDVRQLPLEGRL